jgi:hypothetical protein
MSTELVVRSTDVPEAFDSQIRMAQVVADSSLLPGHLRGKPANVLLVLMGARTLNISAFQALQSIFIVDGKLSMSADMMRALMTRAGHRVRVVERTAKKAVVEVHRHDRDTPYRAEFTYEDAVAAKLIKKENYEKYLKAMLVARATSIVWRDECADVAYGVSYTPEELGAKVHEDGSAQVDNEGRVVLDGEAVEAVSQDAVEAWAEVLVEGDLVKEVLPAWEHIQSRRAAGLVCNAYETSLGSLVAERFILAGEEASTKEALTEVWRIARLVGAMELNSKNMGVVHERLAARAKAIAAAAEQDRAAETPPPVPEIVEVDLDDIERPEVVADPDAVAANLSTWQVDGEVDSDGEPA